MEWTKKQYAAHWSRDSWWIKMWLVAGALVSVRRSLVGRISTLHSITGLCAVRVHGARNLHWAALGAVSAAALALLADSYVVGKRFVDSLEESDVVQSACRGLAKIASRTGGKLPFMRSREKYLWAAAAIAMAALRRWSETSWVPKQGDYHSIPLLAIGASEALSAIGARDWDLYLGMAHAHLKENEARMDPNQRIRVCAKVGELLCRAGDRQQGERLLWDAASEADRRGVKDQLQKILATMRGLGIALESE